jgi:hypothetical protein
MLKNKVIKYIPVLRDFLTGEWLGGGFSPHPIFLPVWKVEGGFVIGDFLHRGVQRIVSWEKLINAWKTDRSHPNPYLEPNPWKSLFFLLPFNIIDHGY